jgi:hypothetical protein
MSSEFLKDMKKVVKVPAPPPSKTGLGWPFGNQGFFIFLDKPLSFSYF